MQLQKEISKFKLQLTNGYKLEFDQVTRILQYTQEQNSFKKIPRQKFVNALGITLMQCKNLSSICVGLDIIRPITLVLTPLGTAVAQNDIFFDNISSLWILHYIISSESKWLVWNRIINKIIPENDNISSNIAKPYFDDLKDSFSEHAITKKLVIEIRSVFNAYCEQKFSRLQILKKVSTGNYQKDEVVQIEPLPFLYCLLHFRDKVYPDATALTIEDIIKPENSPGRVLFLDDYNVQKLLSKLHDLSLIRIENFGDLDQIRFAEEATKEVVLNKIYGIES